MVPENIHTHPTRIFGNSKVEGGLKDIFLKEIYPARKRFHPLLLSERLEGTLLTTSQSFFKTLSICEVADNICCPVTG